ncbi:site-specific integrase [Blastomonas sp. UPD001]|jgi:integrase|uniref:site-specific integrase n=1 Tax=Blastomonas sp. UPD001 TaxID=2217673 RepID=UPI000E3497DA|nr:site-specific integrase [Blastomonas sp. UPD001]
MCSYLHKAPNGVYYFRMGIPADLRPFMGGRREIKRSLGLKDREAAKALIPDMTKAGYALLSQAKRDQAASKPAPVPATKSAMQIERERTRWEHDQLQADLVADDLFANDMEIERLEPVMDALAAGGQVDAPPADIAKAVKLIVANERENAGALIASMQARYGNDARPTETKNQAVECGPGKGIYLDTDIVDGWAAERKPSPRGKDAYWRDAKLFNTMIGRKSVELITKADVMAYKRLLIADPKRSQINVRDRLAYLRTLLEWAAQEDIIPVNVARDVKMAINERRERRKDFSTDDLNALFAGPVHAKGERPKGGFGEAVYWLPLIALFMGARREEIGQLRVQDVRREAYIDDADKRQMAWCIDITDTPDDDALPNQIKNEASNRLVPLHPKLIELGFIDYVKGLPDQSGRVFPGLKPVGIGNKLTDKVGQWFSRYKQQCGIGDKAKVFHSFRHTWKTHAVDAGIPERVCRQFQGHEGKDAADKYGVAPSLRVLVSAIESFRIPGLNINDLLSIDKIK